MGCTDNGHHGRALLLAVFWGVVVYGVYVSPWATTSCCCLLLCSSILHFELQVTHISYFYLVAEGFFFLIKKTNSIILKIQVTVARNFGNFVSGASILHF